MRDEKEERKKQRSKQGQTNKQGKATHVQAAKVGRAFVEYSRNIVSFTGRFLHLEMGTQG